MLLQVFYSCGYLAGRGIGMTSAAKLLETTSTCRMLASSTASPSHVNSQKMTTRKSKSKSTTCINFIEREDVAPPSTVDRQRQAPNAW